MRIKIFVIFLLASVIVFWNCGRKEEKPELKAKKEVVQKPKPDVKKEEIQEPKPKPKKATVQKSEDDYAEIIEFPANLRINANDTKVTLAKIPVGTRLKILNKHTWRSPADRSFKVIWYQVNYKDKIGWISEHTCKIVD